MAIKVPHVPTSEPQAPVDTAAMPQAPILDNEDLTPTPVTPDLPPVKAASEKKAGKAKANDKHPGEPKGRSREVMRQVQNGVPRPFPGSKTGRIWEIADQLSAAAGQPVERAAVIAAATKEGINPATIATQYSHWRKFYGLVGQNAPGRGAAEPAAEQADPMKVQEAPDAS